jgi:hypothetical protein
MPSTFVVPESGLSNPPEIASRVDLPEPERPVSQITLAFWFFWEALVCRSIS